MKLLSVLFSFVLAISCSQAPKKEITEKNKKLSPNQSGFLSVNGTDIYYEDYGQGDPLVLLHGGGSDMYVSFGKAIALLSKNFRVIAFDEQGHGKSPASARAFGFENTADDIAAALKLLKIQNAKFLGFSNGATTGIHLAIRHPGVMKKMVLGSGLYARKGAPKEFWNMMNTSTIAMMPQELKDAYVKRSPRPEDLYKMFEYDSNRMRRFKDISEKAILEITIPVLVMQNDQDVASVEHAVHITRLLPKGRIAILPGPHDNFLGDVSQSSPEMTHASATIITEFLKD